MKKIILLLHILFFFFCAFAQNTRFTVSFSEPLAVFTFVQNLSENARPNSYKKLFTTSKFNTDQYQNLVHQFDSIYLDYEFGFQGYPHKNSTSVLYLLKQNLI